MSTRPEHTEFFVLRTPTLPWDVVRGWSDGLEAAAASHSGGDLDAAVARDVTLLRSRLREIVRRPIVVGAIEAASPNLGARLERWLLGDDGDVATSIEPALVRYVMRMSGRATPFGLFAGCSLGAPGERTDLSVPGVEWATRRTRVSLDWLFAFALRASQDSEVRRELRYRANSTVYRIGPRVRYYGVRIGELAKKPDARTYHLCDVPWSATLDVVLAAAHADGGASCAQIADALLSEYDAITRDEAYAYVMGLVQAQILQPTLLPAVTGGDPLERLIDELAHVPSLSGVRDALACVHARLAQLDAAPPADAPELTRSILSAIGSLGGGTEASAMLRVDLQKRSRTVTLSRRVIGEITAAANLIGTVMSDTDSPLTAFVRDFVERYQDREVPLLEVLDPESGIGFEHRCGVDATALVRNIAIDALPQEERWTERDRFLLGKLGVALGRGEQTIDLTPADIKSLSLGSRRIPSQGRALMATIAAPSSEAVDRGEYRLLVLGGGFSTSAALVGRFLQDDPTLTRLVQASLRDEESHEPHAIHAEIAHHPEGLASNLSRRPLLRDYEIPVAGGSGAPAARQIAPSDLLISVRTGRIILRSRAHGREVVPHLSNAHTYTNPGLALYRFLATLQTQGQRSAFGWDWGRLSTAPFLPRITHGRLVLSTAKWHISGQHLGAIAKLSPAASFRAMQALRVELALPRLISLVEADNVLPVDLDNVLSVGSMLGACKGRALVELSERFPADDDLVAQGEGGAFHHELIIPLVPKRATTGTPHLISVRRAEASPERAKFPGEDWLFVKLYCGSGSSERVLTDVVCPLVDDLRRDGIVSRWFFIRYMDPKWHLRVRLRGERGRLWSEVAPRLFAAISSERHLVHRATLDTYDPEVERYGGADAIELAEQVFEVDSDAAARIVCQCRRDPDMRWRAALLGMDSALGDLSFTVDERRRLVGTLREEWASALRCGAEASREVGERYRARRAIVERLLGGGDSEHPEVLRAVRGRSATLRRVGHRLLELERHGALTATREAIAGSYLHMWANRVFRGSANLHEVVLYDFLFRAYGSALAVRSSSDVVAAVGSAE